MNSKKDAKSDVGSGSGPPRARLVIGLTGTARAGFSAGRAATAVKQFHITFQILL
jgi:hypothetical protein